MWKNLFPLKVLRYLFIVFSDLAINSLLAERTTVYDFLDD